ncbi:uncharacterized protein [Ptychodera flava]|uniref:uncharacterized protein isoform X2 n=1 Tax=Ptychodera flava TaxID=63121 RepID=UPI00396A421F
MGWKTLYTGERAILYDKQGRAKIIEGPERLYVWPRQKFEMMKKYTADQSQYLKVYYKDGCVEHVQGPTAIYLNPLEHKYMWVEKGIALDANEALVVYRQDENGKVTRCIQHGPTVYMLQANEWLHEFSWHGSERLTHGDRRERHPDDPDRKFRKVPNALQFTKLWIIPDQFYFNVDDVRTKDEALITVKLMIFYELEDIEIMLANTEDPIADFINGLSADVVVFAAQLTYEEFMEQAERLNDLAVYPQLIEMVKKIGYKVSKVVFRGYHASSQLTKMHEMAITTRTKLRIEMETQEQKEELKDMELKSQLERSEMESLHIEQEQHKLLLIKQEEENALKTSSKEKMEKTRQLKEDLDARLEIKKKEDDQLLEHLEKLHSMDVDITQYLLSRNPQPGKVVRVVAPDNNKAAIHFHQS